MPSQYLQPSDYMAYGLPEATTVAQVTQASALVDAYLRRPEGLVWVPDYLGLPCYMLGVEPTFTFNSSAPINSGTNIVVPLVLASTAFSDMIGEVVILDRNNPSLVEACVISAMVQGQITLKTVSNTHAANCTIDFGLTIFEEKSLAARRSIGRTSRPPVRLLSGSGRYGYGRRTDQEMGMYNEVNLLAEIQSFGGPPMWVPFDITQCSVSYTTREIWVPAGILLAYYSEVRLRYVSGYAQAALPPIIKQATAQIVANLQANPSFSSQLKTIKTGTTTLERFAPTQLDADTRQMLDTYRITLII